MEYLRRNWPLSILLALMTGALLWACVAPIHTSSREQLFEIPKGTYERRMKGEKVEILPSTVRLTLGLRDVLLLRNADTVPQIFGPVLIMPGQDFRLPFETVSENQFSCSAHASGQMTVIVEPMPNPGLMRLRWRWLEFVHAVLNY
ncbi:MAG: hypothetical protein H7176_10195 [Bdellovibrionales bacterium]|nr:hypothetical protein [Massilia sp.]